MRTTHAAPVGASFHSTHTHISKRTHHHEHDHHHRAVPVEQTRRSHPYTRRVTNAYEVAALAVEQGRASASDLAKATKDAQAADKRVSDLRAAHTAFEAGEATRIADEAAAAAQAEAAALTNALKDLRQAGTAWDAALTQLVAASSDITAAIQRAYGCNANPTQVRQIESARTFVNDILQYRLRDFTGNGGALSLSPQREELQFITSHLPSAQE